MKTNTKILIISRSIVFRMRNVSDKSCIKIKTYFMFLPPPEDRAVYETMWKNIVEQGRPQMIFWRMRIAYWIPKATNTHSG